MPVRIEISVRLPNSPGALAEVCGLLAAEQVGVVALSLDRQGDLRILADNHVRAAGVLAAARHRVSERDVLVVTGSAGALASARLVAEAGVNIDYAYGGMADSGAVVVLGVDDAMRAAAICGI